MCTRTDRTSSTSTSKKRATWPTTAEDSSSYLPTTSTRKTAQKRDLFLVQYFGLVFVINGPGAGDKFYFYTHTVFCIYRYLLLDS